MTGAARQNKPSEEKLRTAYNIMPNLLNCSWYSSGGITKDLGTDAIEYAETIIGLLKDFVELKKEELK